jgi:hypothetical protein
MMTAAQLKAIQASCSSPLFHMGLVLEYFLNSGKYNQLQTYSLRGLHPGPPTINMPPSCRIPTRSTPFGARKDEL